MSDFQERLRFIILDLYGCETWSVKLRDKLELLKTYVPEVEDMENTFH